MRTTQQEIQPIDPLQNANSVMQELKSFGEAIVNMDKQKTRNSPREALQDLAVLEGKHFLSLCNFTVPAVFQSSQQGKAIQPEQLLSD